MRLHATESIRCTKMANNFSRLAMRVESMANRVTFAIAQKACVGDAERARARGAPTRCARSLACPPPPAAS